MKVMTLKKAVPLTIALIGLGLAPTAQAAHAAEYLDPLHTEVATRLENLTPETEASVRRALSKANSALNRNTRTLSADLGVLAQAGTALQSALPDDGVLNGLQNDALNNYSAEAQAQLNAVAEKLGTNVPPPNLARQLDQAQAALDRANDGTNSTAVRAKSIAFALNKIRVANLQVNRTFKAPINLAGKVVTLISRQTGTIVLSDNGTYTIGDPSAPDETGTWEYGRTSNKTATILLSGGRTLNLKFAKPTGGSFTETSEAGTARGKFVVEDAFVPEPE